MTLPTSLRRTEKILSDYVPMSAKDDTVILLRSFLEFLPTSGRVQLMEDIEHAKSKLNQLCQYLYGGIIAPCKEDSNIEVQAEGNFQADELASSLGSSTRACQEWLKDQCFRRDQYRCVLTGAADRSMPGGVESEDSVVYTDCAHIIPFSLGAFDHGHEETTTTIWTALRRYFPDLNSTRIRPEYMNVPENALTMASAFHNAFGRFDFSLDSIDGEENKYRITLYGDFKKDIEARLLPQNLRVVFTTPNAKWLPPPSPVALRIHSCIAKVLDKTGIARQLNEILYENDRFNSIRSLDSDGSIDSTALSNSILIRFYRKLKPHYWGQPSDADTSLRPIPVMANSG
ncbi:hypothetical protein V8E54_001309 [Elaphomyces granulatus]